MSLASYKKGPDGPLVSQKGALVSQKGAHIWTQGAMYTEMVARQLLG